MGADLPAPTASTLGGVESTSCTSGQFLNQISTGGAPLCATPPGASLGNGTTVIDASLQPGVNFSFMVNAAIAACSPGPCTYDLRGFNGETLTMSENIALPAKSEVILPSGATIMMASGTSFDFSQADGSHFHGQGGAGTATILQKSNTTTDYTPIITSRARYPGAPAYVELDHFRLGTTTPSGPTMPITAMAASAACPAPYATQQCNVYTGTITVGDNNAYVGMEFYLLAPPRDLVTQAFLNVGGLNYFICAASSATTLTLITNGWGGAWSGNAASGVEARISGGWGIDGAFISSHFHDITGTPDQGFRIAWSGCSCYNLLDDINLLTLHGGLYFGGDTNANTVIGSIFLAQDEIGEGFLTATGYGVILTSLAAQNQFYGLDIENTKYSLLIKGSDNHISGLGVEGCTAWGTGSAAEICLPTILPGASRDTIDNAKVDVNDLSSNQSNVYPALASSRDLNPNRFGSTQVVPVPNFDTCDTSVGAGSGATLIPYFFVGIDYNGKKTMPFECDITNQTLGTATSTTMPLTGVVEPHMPFQQPGIFKCPADQATVDNGSGVKVPRIRDQFISQVFHGRMARLRHQIRRPDCLAHLR